MTKLREDPAVITWRIALAPRPRLVTRHWWRDLVTQTYRDWRDTWDHQAEAASNGWATELAEFRASNPPPTLRHVLEGLSSGAINPYDPGGIT